MNETWHNYFTFQGFFRKTGRVYMTNKQINTLLLVFLFCHCHHKLTLS